jgi:hypothetical protein
VSIDEDMQVAQGNRAEAEKLRATLAQNTVSKRQDKVSNGSRHRSNAIQAQMKLNVICG